VGQPEGFQFLHGQHDFLQLRQRYGSGLEIAHPGHFLDSLAAGTTGQGFLQDQCPGKPIALARQQFQVPGLDRIK
jgi:hypothetical protein